MGKDTTFLSQISGKNYNFFVANHGQHGSSFVENQWQARLFCYVFIADVFMEITFICTSI